MPHWTADTLGQVYHADLKHKVGGKMQSKYLKIQFNYLIHFLFYNNYKFILWIFLNTKVIYLNLFYTLFSNGICLDSWLSFLPSLTNSKFICNFTALSQAEVATTTTTTETLSTLGSAEKRKRKVSRGREGNERAEVD